MSEQVSFEFCVLCSDVLSDQCLGVDGAVPLTALKASTIVLIR